MSPEEVVVLTRIVQALAPTQKFDEYTADVWHPILANISFADAKTAVTNIGARQAYVAPCDIVAEVRSMRRARLDRLAHVDSTFNPSKGAIDDPLVYLAEYRAWVKAAADGLIEEGQPVLPRRYDDPAQILGKIVKGVPPLQRQQ